MDVYPIVSTRVPEELRAKVLESHFGCHSALLVQNEVFIELRRLCAEYQSAYWHYYELSNGAIYMAPQLDSPRIRTYNGHFDERLTADAAGILCCLCAYGSMFLGEESELLADHYHLLRDYAVQHRESLKILRAIHTVLAASSEPRWKTASCRRSHAL